MRPRADLRFPLFSPARRPAPRHALAHVLGVAVWALCGLVAQAQHDPGAGLSPEDLEARMLRVPRLQVPRLPEGVEAPRIDGVLDELAWGEAALIEELVQVEPLAGGRPSQRTQVLLTYDSKNIYLAARCFDTEPHEIRATQRRRDARLDPDDRIEFVIDPFLSRRNAFWFQVGAGGSMGDALITKNGSSFNKEWNGIWLGRSRITEDGWQVEARIPATTLNFREGNDRWGFNIRRLIRRTNERARWASPQPRHSFFAIAQSGTLEGIDGLDQGLGLDLVPFAVGRYQRPEFDPTGDPAEQDDIDRTGDVGLDAFYRLTPNTKLSVSINTDFAETEVDERQVNLTRFPLFFPEQRDFFLEDSGAFFFGGSTRGRGSVLPFFSRRIGIDGDGQAVPILAATKLTGANDDFVFGVMDVQTRDTDTLEAKNLAVGRLSYNLGQQSDIGVIWTHGNPTEDLRSDTYGADLNLRTNDFLDGQNLRFSSYVLRSDNEGTDEDDLAYQARLDYPNDQVDGSLEYLVVEENFDPALGFVRREGIKQYQGRFSWNPRLRDSDIRQLRFRIDPRLTTDSDNDLQTARTVIQPLGIEWNSGDEISFRVIHTTEVLSEDFEIADNVTIPVGRFDFTRFEGEIETSGRRMVSGSLEVQVGEFFDGTREDFTLGVDARPGAWGTFGVELERNQVHLEDGEFNVNLGRLRANLQFTTELNWSNFLQWDDVSDQMGLNSRLWWILEPGREFFFVINQAWTANAQTFAPGDTQVSAKLGYTFRF